MLMKRNSENLTSAEPADIRYFLAEKHLALSRFLLSLRDFK